MNGEPTIAFDGTARALAIRVREAYQEGRRDAERDFRRGRATLIAICGVMSPTSLASEEQEVEAIANSYGSGYNHRLWELGGETAP